MVFYDYRMGARCGAVPRRAVRRGALQCCAALRRPALLCAMLPGRVGLCCEYIITYIYTTYIYIYIYIHAHIRVMKQVSSFPGRLVVAHLHKLVLAVLGLDGLVADAEVAGDRLVV